MVSGALGELVRLRDLLQMSAPLFWFVLAGLVGCTVWTVAGTRLARQRVPARRFAAALAVGFALVWLVVDKRLEGRTLVILSDRHGITVSDLASVVAVLIAGWRLLPLQLLSGWGSSSVPGCPRTGETDACPGWRSRQKRIS